jgi:hypothetical protein
MSLIGIVTGTYAPSVLPVKIEALKQRFIEIKPTIEQVETHPGSGGGMLYSGNRCTPNEVAWRIGEVDESIEQIKNGEIDETIIAVYYERANAEHWYKYEKDWG